MPTVSKAELEKLFTFDKETGEFYWKNVSKYHKEKNGKLAGFARKGRNDKYYWIIKINGHPYYRSHLSYFMSNGKYATPLVDHINGNSLDDTPSNLREADALLNARNHPRRNIRKLPSGSYQARLGQESLGSFGTLEEAENKYDTERAIQWQT